MIVLPKSKAELDEVNTGAPIGEGEFLCEVTQLPYYDVVGDEGKEVYKFPSKVIDGKYAGWEFEYIIWMDPTEWDKDGSKAWAKLVTILEILGVPIEDIEGAGGFDEAKCLGQRYIGVFKEDKNGYNKMKYPKKTKVTSSEPRVVEELS